MVMSVGRPVMHSLPMSQSGDWRRRLENHFVRHIQLVQTLLTGGIPQPEIGPYYDKGENAEARQKVLFRPIRTVRNRSFCVF